MEKILYILFVIFGLSLMGVGIMQILENAYPKKYEKRYKILSVVMIAVGILLLIIVEKIFAFW